MSKQMEIVPRRIELGLPRLLRQLGAAPTTHQRFTPASLPDGLRGWTSYSTQRHIRQIASSGEALWLATWGGVLCFQSADHQVIRHTSEHGLPGSAIRTITVDAQGIVWAGGERHGLAALAPTTKSAWQPLKELAALRVLCMVPQPERGVIVALSQPQGQYALGEIASPDAPLNLWAQKGLAIRAIEALLFDEKGTLWTGNAWGVHRYEGAGVFETAELKPKGFHLPLQVRALARGLDGGLWVGTNQGLYHFHAEWDDLYQRGATWPEDEVLSMTVDSGGQLWVLTTREVARLVNDEWQPLKKLPTGRLNAIQKVGEQLWLAGANGLYKQQPEASQEAIAPAAEDALSNLVHTLYADSSTVWVGAARGLYRFADEDWHQYDRELRDVRAILPSPTIPSQLWVGTWRKGLRRLLSSVYIPDQPLASPIVALCASADQTLWAATVDAIYRKAPESKAWVDVRCPRQLGLGVIFSLCHQKTQRADNLWVGTSSGLFIYRLDIELALNEQTPEKLWEEVKEIKQPVRALALDPLSNALWIGTSEGLWSEHNWQTHHSANIQSLLFEPAPSGALWIGTTTGLEKWPAPHSEPFATTQPLTQFTSANSGLAANRVTALALRTINQQEQELWIGTTAGVSCYRYPA